MPKEYQLRGRAVSSSVRFPKVCTYINNTSDTYINNTSDRYDMPIVKEHLCTKVDLR